MLDLGRFSAWITIDGKEATEYNVELPDDGESVACWIASEVGKAFEVHWKDKSPHETISGSVWIDGKSIPGLIVRKTDSLLPQEGSISDVPISSTITRSLVFSPTELTDDDSYLSQEVSPDLGTIKLRIYSVVILGKRPVKPDDCCVFEDKVHERSKKLGTHSVKLGEERLCSVPSITKTEKLDQLASFTFQYRPLEILKAQGIVESSTKRKADEPPKPQDDISPDIIELDDDDNIATEIKALRARLDALEAKGIKQGSNKRIKREHRPTFSLGGIIDLT